MMNDDDDDLWKNSLEVDVVVKENYNNVPMIAILQMVGINSQTHTAFGRLLITRNGRRSSYGHFVLGSNKETMAVSDNDDDDDDNLSPTTTSIIVLDLLNLMLREILKSKAQVDDAGKNLLPYSATELLKLGSVWSLSKVNNQNKQIVNIVRKRLSLEDGNKLIRFNHSDGTSIGGSVVDSLRLHYRPSRFPIVEEYDWSVDRDGKPQNQQHNRYQNTKLSLIIHHDPNLGYIVVNKPCGIPSHATVDNGIENVLYQLENQQQQNNPNFSLPQRLDIETCGLLIVAIRPEFSSYMGKLLEKKSIQSLDIIDFDDDDNMQSAVIQKEYKCLVHLIGGEQDRSRLLQRLKATNGIITHYMDPKSIAPKTFIEEQDMSEKGEGDGWLKCVMYIRKVGRCVQWKQQKINSCHRSQQADDDKLCIMMEIHLLLLTGRTHQVRGQMAAMSMPLVGDPLYGGNVSLPKFTIDNLWGENRHRNSTTKTTTTSESSNGNNNKSSLLALQCCSIRFSKPEWACNTTIPPSSSCVEPKSPKDKNNKQKKTKKKRRPMLVESRSSLLSFHLDKAWWTNKIEHLNHD